MGPIQSYYSYYSTYTFVFRNEEQSKIRTIAANVLQRYPKCMLNQTVTSYLPLATPNGGYIIDVQNLDMIDHINNFMQGKILFNFI